MPPTPDQVLRTGVVFKSAALSEADGPSVFWQLPRSF